MRTYISQRFYPQGSSGSLVRQEIRDPVNTELSPRPSDPIISLAHAGSLSPYSRSRYSYDDMPSMRDRTSFTREEYEYHRMVCSTWYEDYERSGISYGHYHNVISYFVLPRGMVAEMDGLRVVEEGEDVYAALGTRSRSTSEHYYRERMRALEQDMMSLRQSRQLLASEEIDRIRNGMRECEEKPVKVQHFDETIFEVD